MSLVDVDTWITEFDACERLSHTILSQITQRNREEKLSTVYSKTSANIRLCLKQFENELSQLKLKLNNPSTQRSITAEEYERRQRQLESLQTQLSQLQNKFRNASRTDREILFQEPRTSLWEDDEDEEPIIPVGGQRLEDVRDQHIQIMEEQNKGLEALAKSISRQKNLATRLGVEVEDQNAILDDLTVNMDRIDSRVSAETGNIGQINRSDSTWRYWLVIVALFVIIMIVALFA